LLNRLLCKPHRDTIRPDKQLRLPSIIHLPSDRHFGDSARTKIQSRLGSPADYHAGVDDGILGVTDDTGELTTDSNCIDVVGSRGSTVHFLLPQERAG